MLAGDVEDHCCLAPWLRLVGGGEERAARGMEAEDEDGGLFRVRVGTIELGGNNHLRRPQKVGITSRYVMTT